MRSRIVNESAMRRNAAQAKVARVATIDQRGQVS